MSRNQKKKKQSKRDYGIEIELTPMIDVVLQLIIFFMLVMDFSSRDLVPLKLAQAQTAQQEEDQDKWTITVNIGHRLGIDCSEYNLARKGEDKNWNTCKSLAHWFFHVRGTKYYIQPTGNEPGMEQLRNDMRAYAEKRRSSEEVDGQKLSEVPLVVRSDYRAPWGMVQQIMSLARDKQIKIYKVKLAAEIPREQN